MLVVADTSALLALAACDGLALLESVFGDIRVPPAVLSECTIPGKAHAEDLRDFLQDRVVTVDLARFIIAAPGLGKGELEAMALYRHLNADRLLLDDGRARRIARFNGIHVVGSIGVILLAKEQGFVPHVAPLLHLVQSAGIRLSEPLVAEALRLAGEG